LKQAHSVGPSTSARIAERGSQVNRTCVSRTNSNLRFDSALSIIQITQDTPPDSPTWFIYPFSNHMRIPSVQSRHDHKIHRPFQPHVPSRPQPPAERSSIQNQWQRPRSGATHTRAVTDYSYSIAVVCRSLRSKQPEEEDVVGQCPRSRGRSPAVGVVTEPPVPR
jgi:hypothetical protein